MNTTELPLFPLPTVLFPGAYLPLRIFEQRYLDMVRDCARDQTDFGICLILESENDTAPSQTAQTGTLARIVDWYTMEDGLLGLSTTGTNRFISHETHQQDNGLLIGHLEIVAEPPTSNVPEAYFVLSQVVSRFMDNVAEQYPDYNTDKLDDASWVSYRLAELLPLSNIEKQNLLEMNDPIDRLQSLLEVLPRFQSDA